MDSAISIQSMTNSQFLTVCSYITSFGLLLNNLGIIKTDERNQTVPVLNALFEYLNKFENQSKTKIQILQALFHETDHDHSGENKTLLDMKIAAEHYRYVINTALFSHYGYITGYLAEIINKRDNITSSILKQRVFRHLPENYTHNDQCSLIKGSTKLTLLAIERIFGDYILPIFAQTWTAPENLSAGQKDDFQQFKRSKRNPFEDSDDDALITDESYEERPNDYDLQTVRKEGDITMLNDAHSNSPHQVEDLSEISESKHRRSNSEISDKVQRLDHNSTKKTLLRSLTQKGETEEDSNISPKVRKVESKESESKSRILDEDQKLDDNSTKKLLPFLMQRKESRELEYNNFFMLLMSVKQNGLQFLRKDKQMYKKFTLQIKALAAQQRKEEWMREGIELWLREPIEMLTHFECLAHLKETEFTFEDITLLTKRNSGHLPHHLYRPYTTDFEMYVLYHVISDTQYGFVDLGRFDNNFTDLFITFPDVIFTVINMTVPEEKYRRTAILQLKRNPLTQQDWYNNENEEAETVNEAGGLESVNDSAEVQHDDISSISKKALATMERNNAEKEGNERMQAVQKAAEFISSTNCKPMREDSFKSVPMLKSYLLKIKQSDSDTSDVPTYGKLAEDYCKNGLEVPEFYRRWWIKNWTYVGDVLFENKFYFPVKSDELFRGMRKLGAYKHTNELEHVYSDYKRNLSALEKIIRFEDFYHIRKAVSREILIPTHRALPARNSTLAALYRFGLKQCNEKWEPVTLYQAKLICSQNYRVYKENVLPVHRVSLFQKFSLFPTLEVRDLSNKPHNDSLKMVLFKIELKGHACGIVNIGRVTPITVRSHVFLFETKFYVNDTDIYEIENKEVLVINLLPKMETPKEDIMVSIVNKLNEIVQLEINPLTRQDSYHNKNEDAGSVNEAGGSESVSDSAEVQHDDIPSISKKALATTERNNAEKEGNERMQAVQKAAEFISSTNCKPMREDSFKSVPMLKSYLLKIKQSDSDTSDVPTYGELAEDYCKNGLEVPEFYRRWWIKNWTYVGDVLFENKFYFPVKSNKLSKGMRKLGAYKHTNDLEHVYSDYKRNLSALEKIIRFEDFYHIRKAVKRKTIIPALRAHPARNSTLAALYRFGFKQCNEKWEPVTLYQAKLIFSRNYRVYKENVLPVHRVSLFQRFSLFPTLEVRDLSNKPHNDSLKMVLFKIELKGHACGIVNIGRVTPIEVGSHVFLFETKFYVNDSDIYEIENKEVLVINLSPRLKTPKEDTMVRIVNELNEIFSSKTKFYVDEN